MKCQGDQHNHQLSDEELKELIKGAQLSVTKPRMAILRILSKEHGPFSAEEILQKLPPNTCDQATLFRTLKSLREKDILRSIRMNEEFARYELACETHHHHVRCTECGSIESLDECAVDAIEREVRNLGYDQINHSLEFTGICSSCQK